MKDSERFLAVAHIVRTQGRHGEVAAEILTDFPKRFEKLRRVRLQGAKGEADAAEIEKAWLHKGRVILKFTGVDSISSADGLRGKHVLIPREERMQLPSGFFYEWELEGCRVIRKSGIGAEEVGKVTEVERTGGTDLLHVEHAASPHRELLIPLASAICTRIDTKAKEIWIDPPEDLLELNR